jgi:hypothetical protein
VQHDGFDWEGIQRAMEKNQRRGRIVAGGSTISQQLAKNLFLSPTKRPGAKAQEAVVTLDDRDVLWSKQRILEVYLNVIEWGNGVFGAEAAARHYYGIGGAAFGRTGGPAGRHGAQPALLRSQPGAPGLAARRRRFSPHAASQNSLIHSAESVPCAAPIAGPGARIHACLHCAPPVASRGGTPDERRKNKPGYHLGSVRELLAKHKLVEDLVHRQECRATISSRMVAQAASGRAAFLLERIPLAEIAASSKRSSPRIACSSGTRCARSAAKRSSKSSPTKCART